MRYCCVPAVITMVQVKHGLPTLPQDQLGYHLGLAVPEELRREYFGQDVPRIMPPTGWGTQLQAPEFNFNRVSRRLGLGVLLTHVPPESFHEPSQLSEYLTEIEGRDGDAVACYRNASGTGHVVLFDRMLSSEVVQAVNPSPALPDDQLDRVHVAVLHQIMSEHGSESMGGIWEFSLSES